MSRISLQPLDSLETLNEHVGTLHAWVTHPRSVYWQMQDATPADVAEEYGRIAADPSHEAHLGRVDGAPAFLAEVYDPAHSELARVPEVSADLQTGDVGMHVLVAPPAGEPVPGFTAAVMKAVLEHCFARPEVQRVVVEPDVRNTKIAALNAAAGFSVVREAALTGKVAAFSVCTRDDFAASRLARSQVTR